MDETMQNGHTETGGSTAMPEDTVMHNLRPRHHRAEAGLDIMQINHILDPSDDETSRLHALAAQVVDQDEIERDIERQVCLNFSGGLLVQRTDLQIIRRTRHSQTRLMSGIEREWKRFKLKDRTLIMDRRCLHTS
jgi:hypothetical protein